MNRSKGADHSTRRSRYTRPVARWVIPALVFVTALAHAQGPSAETSEGDHAPSQPRVVLVVRDPESATVLRLRAELSLLGSDVRVLTSPLDASSRREEMESLAATHEALAVVHLERHAHGLVVWIAERRTRKTVIREIHVDAGSSSEVDDNVAVGTLELLRASLLEARERTSDHAPLSHFEARVVNGPPPIEQRPRTAEPTAFVGLGPNLDAGFGWENATLALQLRGELALQPFFAVEAAIRVPTVPLTWRRPAGSADVLVFSGAIGALARIHFGRVGFGVGPGLALEWIHLQGHAAASYMSLSESSWIPALNISGLVRVRLTSRWSLNAQAVLGWALTRSTIAILSDPVGRRGPLLPSMVLAIEYAFVPSSAR